MSSLTESDGRRLELLSGRVLGDLSEEERFEVSMMLQDEAFRKELFELERSAAAIQLAALAPEQQLPKSLRARLETETQRYVGVQPQQAAPAKNSREMLAWLCCAAALLLSLGLWLGGQGDKSTATISTALARLEFMQRTDDIVQVDWASGTTPFETQVSGDVVWSNATQTGYMRFTGMPKNDPSAEQYQLWIIDPGRDDEPIDGGVFNISDSGEVVVPILAKLNVVSPKAFAITIEKPGGVVVSTQERLPLLAAIE